MLTVAALHVFTLLLVVFLHPIVVIHGHSHISRHLVMEDLSMVVIMAEAEQTQGPFAEQEDDYVNATNDLTAAGKAGSPGGLLIDRASVVEGVPLTLTLNVYDISNMTGIEMENVEVYLWHTDAVGIYSAVDGQRQPNEDTDGQVWCRGMQVTGPEGNVTFRTILPGWYGGRAIHYHLRLRMQGEELYAATSQLYVADQDVELYDTMEPYVSNNQVFTPLAMDRIYDRLQAEVLDLLTMDLEGSVETGFTSTVNLGLLPTDVSDSQGEFNPRPNSGGAGGGGGCRPGRPGCEQQRPNDAMIEDEGMIAPEADQDAEDVTTEEEQGEITVETSNEGEFFFSTVARFGGFFP